MATVKICIFRGQCLEIGERSRARARARTRACTARAHTTGALDSKRRLLQVLGDPQRLQQLPLKAKDACCKSWGPPRGCSSCLSKKKTLAASPGGAPEVAAAASESKRRLLQVLGDPQRLQQLSRGADGAIMDALV